MFRKGDDFVSPTGCAVTVVGEIRRPLPDDHPLIEQERAFVAQLSDAIKTVREGRDSASERLFDLIYATPLRPSAGRAGESLPSKAAN